MEPKNSGGVLFLELAFKAIGREIYTDLTYAKQNSAELGNDYRKNVVEGYLKKLFNSVWYDSEDVKKFTERPDISLINTSNRREMMRLVLPIIRDIADARPKTSKEFWEGFSLNL